MDKQNNSLFLLDAISSGFLVATTFLLPIFFLPANVVSIDFAKGGLLAIFVSLSFLLWLVARLKEGVLNIPRSFVLFTAASVVVVFLVSSLLSPAVKVSLFGLGHETGTFIVFLVLFLLMFLSSVFFQNMDKILHVYSALVVAALILALYQGARLIFGVDFLSFNAFTSSASNLFGKYNDMALFFGLTGVFSLVTLQLLTLRGSMKIIFHVLLFISLFFLTLANFSLAWILMGIFSVLVLVYGLSFERKRAEVTSDVPVAVNHIPFTPLVVAIVSLLFLLPGNLGNVLSTSLGISQVEVRPSWGATLEIASRSLFENPVFGSGPNRFEQQWFSLKPDGINNTLFWDTGFAFGIGMIPTFATTLGIAGILAWVLFLLSFLYTGVKALITPHKDRLINYFIFSSFLSASYLWIVAVFYVPNIVNLSFAFLFTGIFVAMLTKGGLERNYKISVVDNPRIGFITVLLLIVMIVSSAVLEYFFVQRFLSGFMFNKAIAAFNVGGDINSTESSMLRATELYEYDMYLRALSELQTVRFGNILSISDVSEDVLREQFQNTLGNAISYARRATEADATNYLNWESLGNVYASVVPLNIEGAYDNALASYEKALEKNPKSPALYLTLARLEVARGDIEKARARIEESLTLKQDYAQAIFFLSQIEAKEGNIRAAIESTERASLIAPNDIGVFFQLGFLKYKDGNYSGAIVALERAVMLNPVYANAKYFLGLSYDQVGRRNDAIAQFEDIGELNPENSEVKEILNNLRGGREPFTDVAPPLPLPEERDALPIKGE
ncbi:MAG: tetratricopeptide repeat protein [Patescibacteria group bacterium]|nr:tetratricopeptide repeat protein [Patescibacteria group bacterium]